MSDEGEKTCPLCAEEMDLTDKQLKPCKCGYEICVWCWHHIMNMAEKDDSKGRCPACRTPYDKEKIVGMAAKCEREVNMDKKGKSHKTKSKTSEGRKPLSSVRVIQRNLVYIMGLPLNLADEDLLQRKEYFGQYGKVLKVSISRTSAGAIQHFANSTCSVYITYSKEDEAIRCIQSVHGFLLDGRALRVSFGTTKYCHAWLRSMPCTNPDCLYLHEIGSQEDSYTKDELITAYTRNRVQQITGATNDMQRRSGNMLPPPADEYYFNNDSSASSANPISKTPPNNPASGPRASPPPSSSGRPVALPAAASWSRVQQITGATNDMQRHSGNMLPPSADEYYSNNGSVSSANPIFSKTPSNNPPSGLKVSPPPSSSGTPLALPAAASWGTRATNSQSPPANIECSNGPSKPKSDLSSSGSLAFSTAVENPDKVSIGKKINDETLNPILQKGKLGTFGSIKHFSAVDQGKSTDLNINAEQKMKSLCINEQLLQRTVAESSDLRSDSPTQLVANRETDNDLLSFDDERLKDPEVSVRTSFLPDLSQSLNFQKDSRVYSSYMSTIVNKKPDHTLSNGFHEDKTAGSSNWDTGFQYSYSTPNDMGESSIISNILSLDSDSWEESLTSPQNIAKLLGESTDNKQKVQFRGSNSWKVQNNNNNQQSRFSFAREDCVNQISDVDPSLSNIGQAYSNQSYGGNFANNGDFYLGKFGNSNGFSSGAFEAHDRYTSGHSVISANKLSGSRSQISAPPGFSVPNRAPPPGFSVHERFEQTSFDTAGNQHVLGSSSLRNQYQTQPPVSYNTSNDIEFIDPAILAVGKGSRLSSTSSFDMRSNFNNPPQLNTFETDQRLQFLQNLANNNNNLSNGGHWDVVQSGNDMEILRNNNERLGGVNKYYEDSMYHHRMHSSGDLYNRPYGI